MFLTRSSLGPLTVPLHSMTRFLSQPSPLEVSHSPALLRQTLSLVLPPAVPAETEAASWAWHLMLCASGDAANRSRHCPLFLPNPAYSFQK